MTGNRNPKELLGRLKRFALDFVKLVKMLPKTEENRIFGHQGIRSSSSVGANYSEAMYAYTLQDFLHTINICRKETSETNYWAEMLLMVNPTFAEAINKFLDEGNQILKIFVSSIKTAEGNKKNGK